VGAGLILKLGGRSNSLIFFKQKCISNMDPLSLVANIIAVVSAANEVARRLEKIRSFRGALDQLLQVINEVLTLYKTKHKGQTNSPRFPIYELSLQQFSKYVLNWKSMIRKAPYVRNSKSCFCKQDKILRISMALRRKFRLKPLMEDSLKLLGDFGYESEKMCKLIQLHYGISIEK